MTKDEYKDLKRFERNDHQYYHNLIFTNDDIFEIYSMQNTKIYCKVKSNVNNYLFDLVECNEKGDRVRMPIKKNCISHPEIMNRIIENDWRVFFKNKK
ncbi:MAG: hypothetical protein CVV22_02565 [Ignavibacteriae bacterium HGW-Ignavibacteriae-1]|jgi:hypothetical protein|nr:MAG: hypothetical protein CVV22_02565 [Ignavibacteriae bacterium HGW-Ignavibacteriae-1]